MAQLRAMGPVLALLALPGVVSASERSLAQSWIAMVEGCVAFAETGRRGVFDGWGIAFDGGGVCNGDPVCEDDDMTFIAPDALGTGAVTVRVGQADWVGARHFGAKLAEAAVASFPAHGFCSSAAGVQHSTADLGTAHRVWVLRERAHGRLFPAESYVSIEAGPYLGCGYDGRPFLIEFSLARPGPAILRLNYPTRSRAAPEAQINCSGVTS